MEENQQHQPLVINEHQVAAMIGVSVSFVRKNRYGFNGPMIPFFKMGDLIRYRKMDVEAFIIRLAEHPITEPVASTLTRNGKRRGRPTKAEQLARQGQV
ncbi:MAG: helix-turn-helix domain-containing protein [Pseudomonadota bacterium]|nr:helix-turn-helix domain-containing protein [Pseudomonadota bacterium]